MTGILRACRVGGLRKYEFWVVLGGLGFEGYTFIPKMLHLGTGEREREKSVLGSRIVPKRV